MFGLRESDLSQLKSLIKKYPQIEKVIIFGSRAKGNYRPGSDVDIALKGVLTDELLLEIKYLLNEESDMPYFFDVLDYHTVDNPDLIKHIDRVGIVL